MCCGWAVRVVTVVSCCVVCVSSFSLWFLFFVLALSLRRHASSLAGLRSSRHQLRPNPTCVSRHFSSFLLSREIVFVIVFRFFFVFLDFSCH